MSECIESVVEAIETHSGEVLASRLSELTSSISSGSFTLGPSDLVIVQKETKGVLSYFRRSKGSSGSSSSSGNECFYHWALGLSPVSTATIVAYARQLVAHQQRATALLVSRFRIRSVTVCIWDVFSGRDVRVCVEFHDSSSGKSPDGPTVAHADEYSNSSNTATSSYTVSCSAVTIAGGRSSVEPVSKLSLHCPRCCALDTLSMGTPTCAAPGSWLSLFVSSCLRSLAPLPKLSPVLVLSRGPPVALDELFLATVSSMLRCGRGVLRRPCTPVAPVGASASAPTSSPSVSCSAVSALPERNQGDAECLCMPCELSRSYCTLCSPLVPRYIVTRTIVNYLCASFRYASALAFLRASSLGSNTYPPGAHPAHSNASPGSATHQVVGVPLEPVDADIHSLSRQLASGVASLLSSGQCQRSDILRFGYWLDVDTEFAASAAKVLRLMGRWDLSAHVLLTIIKKAGEYGLPMDSSHTRIVTDALPLGCPRMYGSSGASRECSVPPAVLSELASILVRHPIEDHFLGIPPTPLTVPLPGDTPSSIEVARLRARTAGTLARLSVNLASCHLRTVARYRLYRPQGALHACACYWREPTPRNPPTALSLLQRGAELATPPAAWFTCGAERSHAASMDPWFALFEVFMATGHLKESLGILNSVPIDPHDLGIAAVERWSDRAEQTKTVTPEIPVVSSNSAKELPSIVPPTISTPRFCIEPLQPLPTVCEIASTCRVGLDDVDEGKSTAPPMECSYDTCISAPIGSDSHRCFCGRKIPHQLSRGGHLISPSTFSGLPTTADKMRSHSVPAPTDISAPPAVTLESKKHDRTIRFTVPSRKLPSWYTVDFLAPADVYRYVVSEMSVSETGRERDVGRSENDRGSKSVRHAVAPASRVFPQIKCSACHAKLPGAPPPLLGNSALVYSSLVKLLSDTGWDGLVRLRASSFVSSRDVAQLALKGGSAIKGSVTSLGFVTQCPRGADNAFVRRSSSDQLACSSDYGGGGGSEAGSIPPTRKDYGGGGGGSEAGSIPPTRKGLSMTRSADTMSVGSSAASASSQASSHGGSRRRRTIPKPLEARSLNTILHILEEDIAALLAWSSEENPDAVSGASNLSSAGISSEASTAAVLPLSQLQQIVVVPVAAATNATSIAGLSDSQLLSSEAWLCRGLLVKRLCRPRDAEAAFRVAAMKSTFGTGTGGLTATGVGAMAWAQLALLYASQGVGAEALRALTIFCRVTEESSTGWTGTSASHKPLRRIVSPVMQSLINVSLLSIRCHRGTLKIITGVNDPEAAAAATERMLHSCGTDLTMASVNCEQVGSQKRGGSGSKKHRASSRGSRSGSRSGTPTQKTNTPPRSPVTQSGSTPPSPTDDLPVGLAPRISSSKGKTATFAPASSTAPCAADGVSCGLCIHPKCISATVDRGFKIASGLAARGYPCPMRIDPRMGVVRQVVRSIAVSRGLVSVFAELDSASVPYPITIALLEVAFLGVWGQDN